MSQDNVKIVQDTYAAFGRGDIAAILASFDPKIVWNQAENNPYADGNPYVGHEAVLGLLGRIVGDWDLKIVPDEILDAGDTVVMRGRYDGAYKATGARINAQVVHVLKIRDGKVIQFQQYMDTAQVRDAMKQRAGA